ncbi:hypothetical protein [Providencia hangzhouensis]|uniref:hypothetical protein n=1 Tax=Providencia hangzhouensis TaxID=3031799 RepID=UPI0034DD6ED6
MYYLNELTKTTADLNSNAKSIFKLITHRYKSGIAKYSDVEQASLLMQRIETELQNIEKRLSNISLILSFYQALPFLLRCNGSKNY